MLSYLYRAVNGQRITGLLIARRGRQVLLGYIFIFIQNELLNTY